MAFLLRLALLSLLHIVAFSAQESLVVTGKVYCDACAAGHFTKSSAYLPGAHVGVRCASPQGVETAYVEGATDKNGLFQIQVTGDHERDLCVAALLRSPSATCNVLTQKTLDHVQLTRNNGLATNVVNTGPFSFKPAQVSAACIAEIIY